jgi:hypothetical protein
MGRLSAGLQLLAQARSNLLSNPAQTASPRNATRSLSCRVSPDRLKLAEPIAAINAKFAAFKSLRSKAAALALRIATQADRAGSMVSNYEKKCAFKIGSATLQAVATADTVFAVCVIALSPALIMPGFLSLAAAAACSLRYPTWSSVCDFESSGISVASMTA